MWPFNKKVRLVENVEFKFALGSVAKDNVTGFEGVIVARCQWLNACNIYTVQPRKLKDGHPGNNISFDEPQLTLVSGVQFESNRRTGGPERSAPKSH